MIDLDVNAGLRGAGSPFLEGRKMLTITLFDLDSISRTVLRGVDLPPLVSKEIISDY